MADPGLQPERTSLSWTRTSMSVAVVALILVRWLPSHGPVVLFPALVAFALAAAIRIAVARSYPDDARALIADMARRRGEPTRLRTPHRVSRPGWVVTLSGTVTLLGVAGLVIIVVW